MSQPARGCVRQRHVESMIAQRLPACFLFPHGLAGKRRPHRCGQDPRLPGQGAAIPPHAWVSGSGLQGLSSPVAFIAGWAGRRAAAGAQPAPGGGTGTGGVRESPRDCLVVLARDIPSVACSITGHGSVTEA